MHQQISSSAAARPVPASFFRVEAAPRDDRSHRLYVAIPARRRLVRARIVPKSSSSSFSIGANGGDDGVSGASSLPSPSTSSTSSASSSASSSTSQSPDPMRPYRRAQSRSMVRFMLPAALIPLADPLLTLVDVLFVSHGGDLLLPPAAGGGAAGALGRALLLSSSSSSSSLASGVGIAATATEQLAALSPNAQIFTFIQYMLGGLGGFFLSTFLFQPLLKSFCFSPSRGGRRGGLLSEARREKKRQKNKKTLVLNPFLFSCCESNRQHRSGDGQRDLLLPAGHRERRRRGRSKD